MLKNLMNKKSKSKGFTLIELIIVIAIIAILAAVAVPKYLETKAKSTYKADVSNAKIVYDTTVSLITDDKLKISDVQSLVTVDPNGAAGIGKTIAEGMDTSNLTIKNKTCGTDALYRVQANNTGDIKVYDQAGHQVYPDDNNSNNRYSAAYTGKYNS